MRHVRIIYFSPTGGTKRSARAFSSRYSSAEIRETDVTTPDPKGFTEQIINEDLVILAAPVYEGRLPKPAVERFNRYEGHKTPAVCLITYGQVEFGSSLAELEQVARSMGLDPVASIAAVAQHSFTTASAPLAEGRPDKEDIRQLKTCIPGSHPTSKVSLLIAKIIPRNGSRILTYLPRADKTICTGCGICVQHCPVGAIDPKTLHINSSQCFRCFACVQNCPQHARKIRYHASPIVRGFLNWQNKHRKSVEVFYTAPYTKETIPQGIF